MSSLEQGRIVWAEVADPQGANPKRRPVVILTPSDQVPEGEPLLAVAVTTQLPEPAPSEYVLLPWHPQKQVRTRLSERCAAVCTWLVKLRAEDVLERAGVVPGKQLMAIITKVAALGQRAAGEPGPADG